MSEHFMKGQSPNQMKSETLQIMNAFYVLGLLKNKLLVNWITKLSLQLDVTFQGANVL